MGMVRQYFVLTLKMLVLDYTLFCHKIPIKSILATHFLLSSSSVWNKTDVITFACHNTQSWRYDNIECEPKEQREQERRHDHEFLLCKWFECISTTQRRSNCFIMQYDAILCLLFQSSHSSQHKDGWYTKSYHRGERCFYLATLASQKKRVNTCKVNAKIMQNTNWCVF